MPPLIVFLNFFPTDFLGTNEPPLIMIPASHQEMNRNRMRTKMRGEMREKMRGEANKSQTRQRPEQGRPQGGLKMRPMRVKVRKQGNNTKLAKIVSSSKIFKTENEADEVLILRAKMWNFFLRFRV